MTAYPDTSFLYGIYLPQSTSAPALAHYAAMIEALHVTELLLFEFRQSLRLQAFRYMANRREGIDPREVELVLRSINADLRSGVLVEARCDVSSVIGVAESLSAQCTQTRGDRPFDILHVATAVLLGATTLLSFDVKQRSLASLAGLQVAPVI